MRDAIKKYPNDKVGSIKKAVDDIQSKLFKCCGADSYKDWVNMTVKGWPNNTVPQSCCKGKTCNNKNIYGHENEIYTIVSTESIVIS